MKKILIIFGTRPEAIKMAPLCKICKEDDEIITKVCITAQHRKMLDDVLEIFSIKPDFDLDIMKPNQNLFNLTSDILLKTKEVLHSYRPDIVLVHGDTTTAFAAAISSFYSGIVIGHVEAGLRTNNLDAPFPEEFNRQAIGVIAKYHFTPTKKSADNLLSENVLEENIFITGNTVIDSLHLILSKIEDSDIYRDRLMSLIFSNLNFSIETEKFILITGHRRENFGSGFLDICEAIKKLAIDNPNMHFVYPVHLNPNVLDPVNKILSNQQNIHLIQPQEYETFIMLLKNCYLVLTDSGGIQEEAPSLGKPVLVMRDVTERPEALESGTVKLVGSSSKEIYKNVMSLINDSNLYKKMSESVNPYGDGNSSERILKIIKEKII